MAKLADPKEPEEQELDTKPRKCRYHDTEMVSVPPVGTLKYGMKERKILYTWVCTHKPKCSYTINIIE
jgi:hypothetical protein